jgi:hypothetical protein
VKPWLRRIYPACFAGNRILAIRSGLSWRHRRFGLFSKILLVADRSGGTRFAAAAFFVCADIWND